MTKIKKGDIFYADLSPTVGSEQGGIRPVLIIQNDVGNEYSTTVIITCVTSQKKKMNMGTHVLLNEDCGLEELSIATLEQVRTIDKLRLREKIGSCDNKTMKKINKAIKVSFFLTDDDYNEVND